MSLQIIVKPQGILTEPNKVGQFPPGALASAVNAAIRSFGVIEQVKQFTAAGFTIPGIIVGGMYTVVGDGCVVFVGEFGTVGTWYALAVFALPSGSPYTVTTALGATYSGFMTSNKRTGMLMMRNRLIITSNIRSFAIDYIIDPATGLYVAIGPRNCGMYQGAIQDRGFNNVDPETGGILPPNTHMSACVVMKQVHPDGYELLSPPSVPYDFANLSTTFTQVPSRWTARSQLVTSTGNPGLGLGYINSLQIYRTREQSVGYDSVNNLYDPVSTGSSFYLSKSAVSTTSTVTLTDGTLNNSLGEALLTNVSSEGASALPYPPPPAKTCAVFRGYAFYANRVDTASVTLLAPYYWGQMIVADELTDGGAPFSIRELGVGVRFWPAGTATSGSATLTSLFFAGGGTNKGVVAGQDIVVRRNDTQAIVLNGKIVSGTSTTLTADTTSSYSGSVNISVYDVIEIDGVRCRADLSPQLFAYAVSIAFLDTHDLTCVGIEPIESRPTAGVYPSYVPSGGISIRERRNSVITLRATNGSNYSPELPEITATAKRFESKEERNAVTWSENNEPENCPASNYDYVGQGEIYKIVPTRDCLWFFCSDGLYRLSGSGGSVANGFDWSIDPIDQSLSLTDPDCAVAYKDYVYAYTSRGLVSISSEGQIRELSDGRINGSVNAAIVSTLPNRGWAQLTAANASNSDIAFWMTADALNDEIWLRTGLNSPVIWVYNTKTDTFCQRFPKIIPGAIPTFGVFHAALGDTVLGLYGRVLCGYAGDSIYSSEKSNSHETMALTFQPVYGAGNTAAHTQKHWQDVQISFRTPLSFGDATVFLVGADANSTQFRTIPASTVSSGVSTEKSRVGFTIPRNFPAMSNSCGLRVLVLPSPTVNTPVALEAISISYIDFTSQRVSR